jgi:hypothetical protein
MKTILENGKECFYFDEPHLAGPLIAMPAWKLHDMLEILEKLVDGQEDADPYYDVKFSAKFDLDYFYGIKHDFERILKVTEDNKRL